MNTQSRPTNNGIATQRPLSLMEADVQHDATERGAATTSDTALVPTDAVPCRLVTTEPLLNGLNGKMNGQMSDKPCQPRDPKAFRDALGRFVKGYPGGPGNPYRRRVSHLRRAVAFAISDQEVTRTMRNLLRRADDGDNAATTILLTFAVGRPTPGPDPDMDDVHEWQINKQLCVTADEFQSMLDSLPADLACALVEKMWPVFLKKFKQDLLQVVTHPPAELTELQPAPGLNVPET